MSPPNFLKRLINWFLGKAPPKLQTFEEETIDRPWVSLRRYRRKTRRAYRTWRAVYKGLNYDLIFGWDTLAYMPDVPVMKQNRLSTHLVSIYRQGFHARYNPKRGCHEPDITILVETVEVCLESDFMPRTVQHWRSKTRHLPENQQVHTTDDVVNLIIDRVAKRTLDHSPSIYHPDLIDWRETIQNKTRSVLGNPNHVVFPDPIKPIKDDWVG